jgi:hypothetical protein
MFGSKKDGVTATVECRREMHNEELRNLYFSTNIRAFRLNARRV